MYPQEYLREYTIHKAQTRYQGIGVITDQENILKKYAEKN